MEQLTLGTVIANRELLYSDREHGTQSVQVLLGAPVESPLGGEWYCPWRILGIGHEQVRAAYGVDSFQCLQLALKMIGASLHALAVGGAQIAWMCGEPGDFGFPVV